MFVSFVRVLLYLVITRTGLSANRQVAVYYPDRDNALEHRIIPLGFREDKIYLRDQYKIYELNASNLDIVRSARVCFSPCSPNSIVLINDIEGVITVCESAENKVCSSWSTSDFKPLGNSSVTVTVSQLLTRPAIGIVTKDGSSYVAVTYGPGIKPDRFFVISRIRSAENPLNRDKALPFKLPHNVGLEDFLIFFKGAVELEEHVFFITNQKFKAGKNQKYTSKLISVCKDDSYFYTYTDIVLECRSRDNIFNLIQDIQVFTPSEKLRKEFNLDATETDVILAGIFSTGDDPDRPENASAVCLYSMKDVRRKISEAREKFVVCPGSNLTENERYMDNNIPGGCLNVDVTVAARLSGECEITLPLYSYVIGEVVLSADTMFVSPSSDGRLTKVFVKTVEDVQTRKQVVLIFAGTSSGKVLTIRIISATSGHVVDEITVDAEHQIKALRVDKEENIYAATDRKLVKFEPFNCSRYKSCKDVTTSLNPLCGWCVYQSRSVSNGSHCHHAQEPNHFIPPGGNCSSLSLTSDYLEVGKVSQIFFQVSNFPSPLADDEFYCEFNMNHGKHAYFDVAKIGENASFTCHTPNITHHSKAVLKVLVTTNSILHRHRHNVTVAQTSVHFYDCQVFQRCSECTENSKRQCIWNMEDGCCRRSLTNKSSSVALKPSSCPFTKRLAPETPYIHADITTTVFIEIGNVNESIGLKCCVQGCPCSDATFDNLTMIYCPVLVGNSGTAKQTLPLQIQYAGRNLDTTEAITVTVYDCRHLVTDCSQCNSLDSTKFTCTWCHPGTCSFRSTGDCQPLKPCPPPVLTKINPASSPLGGGTLVTISGHDIGTSPGSISTIQLAGIPCSLIEDVYVVSLTVVCRTGDAGKQADKTDFPGKVQITIGNITSSGLKFIYKDPAINRIFPTSGPRIGGTVITLSGSNLEIGNRNVTACFMTDDNRKICKKASVIKSDTSTSEEHHIETVTPPSGSATEVVAVEVIFDNNTHRQIKSSYQYLPDPVIEAVHPMRSILSGGIEITVLGRRLQNARSAGIYATYKNQKRFRHCDFKSDKHVECPTPSLGQPDINLAWKTEITAVVHLDGVEKAFDLDYYIDPEIGTRDFVINSVLDVTHGDILIEGRHLTLGATLSDVKVTVGQASCHIVTFNATFIKCMVPKRLCELEKLLPVNVSIGDLNKVVGYIHQDMMTCMTAGSFYMTVVILSSLSGFFGIIVLSVVLWRLEICVRKNKTRQRFLSKNRLSGQDNTQIQPSRWSRHSNRNIYDVIDDLIPENSMQRFLSKNRLSGQDNTQIQPSRGSRHSNRNIYDVIDDLIPENSIHIDQTNRPLKTNDDETHYQALDDDIPSETQRSASPDEIVRSTDLNINDDNDYNARKEYYLSPLNELKDRIGSRDEPDSSTWEVRNDEN